MWFPILADGWLPERAMSDALPLFVPPRAFLAMHEDFVLALVFTATHRGV